MFNGLRTVVYHVEDITAAKAWWRQLLGFEPYFDQPFYVGFSVGGYELGLHPKDRSELVGAFTYWGVDQIGPAFDKLVNEMHATVVQSVQDVGDGIKVAAALDRDGNVIGLIENPHFSLPAAR